MVVRIMSRLQQFRWQPWYALRLTMPLKTKHGIVGDGDLSNDALLEL